MIQKAWEDKAFFFKPWIGRLYGEGVQLPNSGCRMKTLVIGASRYCEYLKEHGENACSNREACCFCHDYDQLMRIADRCPFVNDSAARGNTNRGLKNFDINTASILKTIHNGHAPKAYKSFQEVMGDLLGLDNPQKVWLHLAFVNYFQPIVWNEGKKRTRTPSVSKFEETYAESRRAIEKLIEVLDPDVILVWLPRQFRDEFKCLYPDAEPIAKALKDDEMKFPTYYLNVKGHRTLLQTTPHPTANYDYGSFIKKSSQK